VGSSPTCATNLMTIKRNHWTNEEVIKILRQLKLDPSYDHYNYAIDIASQYFSNFEKYFMEENALAYLTNEDKIIRVGQ
jgi:hypothetical protein